MKYKKRPVTIEAVKFNGYTEKMFSEHPEWLEKAIKSSVLRSTPAEGKLSILTLEGPMKASKGDYIIKGVDGELYACKPDIFARTYEVVK